MSNIRILYRYTVVNVVFLRTLKSHVGMFLWIGPRGLDETEGILLVGLRGLGVWD